MARLGDSDGPVDFSLICLVSDNRLVHNLRLDLCSHFCVDRLEIGEGGVTMGANVIESDYFHNIF